MGYNSTVYNIVLVAHVLCAIVGFGGVMLNGVYAARARALPPEQALAVSEVNTFVSLRVAEIFIYLVAILGFGLIGLSDKVYAFSDLWIWLSLLLYVVSLLVSLFVLQPRVRGMVATQREMVAAGPPAGGPPPQAAQLQATGKEVAAISGVLHLSMVVILGLMVFKPM